MCVQFQSCAHSGIGRGFQDKISRKKKHKVILFLDTNIIIVFVGAKFHNNFNPQI